MEILERVFFQDLCDTPSLLRIIKCVVIYPRGTRNENRFHLLVKKHMI
jgi:hypothetical protein